MNESISVYQVSGIVCIFTELGNNKSRDAWSAFDRSMISTWRGVVERGDLSGMLASDPKGGQGGQGETPARQGMTPVV